MAPVDNIRFGVEIEFIVFYMRKSTPYTETDSNNLYGPVTIVPDYLSEYVAKSSPDLCVRRRQKEEHSIHQQVAGVIRSTGSQAHCSLDSATKDIDSYNVWNVVEDGSLLLSDEACDAYKPLEHAGVEITSPVFGLVEQAFEEITRVIGAIKSNFRTAVPPVSGLHVHIGRGGKPLELFAMQRIASLLWMAEPLLNNLHPGYRLSNSQCLGLRNFSKLGHGWVCSDEDDTQDIRHPNLLKHTFKDQSKSMNLTHEDCHFVPWDINTYPMREQAADYCNIELVNVYNQTQYRGAYNFENLAFYKGNAHYDKRKGPEKPTIELRQAAGSLDEQWIVLYIRICAALCGRAVVEATSDDFSQLLYNCQRGEDDLQSYNLFDLLHDLGMGHSDIMALHSRLNNKEHELEHRLRFCRAVACRSSEISREELHSVLPGPEIWDVASTGSVISKEDVS
ncbi:hypothetical protein GGR57DRAFT_515697 [Xylariaceae sp. FL1272]|nr:hypothetical protein GGR57DRAFT_515697 [Xylariaceae sp. FL1272]